MSGGNECWFLVPASFKTLRQKKVNLQHTIYRRYILYRAAAHTTPYIGYQANTPTAFIIVHNVLHSIYLQHTVYISYILSGYSEPSTKGYIDTLHTNIEKGKYIKSL